MAVVLIGATTLTPLAASAAPGPVRVSLTFDDGWISQYNLGYQRALQPHNVHATFFVNSGTWAFPGFMSVAQLKTLETAGNAVGGKTVNAVDLTAISDAALVKHQICDDRQALLSQGLSAVAFAYPSGATQRDRSRRS